jgi:hypothetical protein
MSHILDNDRDMIDYDFEVTPIEVNHVIWIGAIRLHLWWFI